MRRAVALLALALVAGCGGGDDDPEIRPGLLRIGVIAAPSARDQLVRRGVHVAAVQVNDAGGIGGAAPIELVTGTPTRLIARGVRLFVLPCDQVAARTAAGVVRRERATAVAPCDDGPDLPSARVFATGLPPEAQAAALADVAPQPAALAPTRTERGREVERRLAEHVELVSSEPTIGADAPEAVRPPGDALPGVVYVTYGFPEPGSEVDEFYERYKAIFHRRPESIVAALGADALAVLAAAIEEAGSPDPDAVTRQIHDEGVEVAGVVGTIEFAGDGASAETEWVALRVEDGRYRVVDRAD